MIDISGLNDEELKEYCRMFNYQINRCFQDLENNEFFENYCKIINTVANGIVISNLISNPSFLNSSFLTITCLLTAFTHTKNRTIRNKIIDKLKITRDMLSCLENSSVLNIKQEYKPKQKILQRTHYYNGEITEKHLEKPI